MKAVGSWVFAVGMFTVWILNWRHRLLKFNGIALMACALIASPGYSQCTNASVPATQAAANALRAAVEHYTHDCGVPPPTNAVIAALIDNPGHAGWAGPYVRRTVQGYDVRDAWGRSFRILVDTSHSVFVSSAGGDGLWATADDIQGQ